LPRTLIGEAITIRYPPPTASRTESAGSAEALIPTHPQREHARPVPGLPQSAVPAKVKFDSWLRQRAGFRQMTPATIHSGQCQISWTCPAPIRTRRSRPAPVTSEGAVWRRMVPRSTEPQAFPRRPSDRGTSPAGPARGGWGPGVPLLPCSMDPAAAAHAAAAAARYRPVRAFAT